MNIRLTAGVYDYEVTLPLDSHPLYVAQMVRDIANNIARRIEEGA